MPYWGEPVETYLTQDTREYMTNWKMNVRGLSECCVETMKQHNAPGLCEGHILQCVWCPAEIVWEKEEWRHYGKGQFSGQSDLLKEVNENG